MDGNSCGQFTPEGIHSLVIKGLCRNQGRLGVPGHDVYSGVLLSLACRAQPSAVLMRILHSVWRHCLEDRCTLLLLDLHGSLFHWDLLKDEQTSLF